MGADIHSYVEYKEKNSNYWMNLTRNFGYRDYIWFGIIAGVRAPEFQLFEPKGLPKSDLGFWTDQDLWILVAPEDNPSLAEHDGWCSLESANRWIEGEYASSIPVYDQNGKLKKVTHPDWHSKSWLNTEELERAIEHYRICIDNNNFAGYDKNPVEWIAIFEAMKSFERMNYDTRLVFWFDN